MSRGQYFDAHVNKIQPSIRASYKRKRWTNKNYKYTTDNTLLSNNKKLVFLFLHRKTATNRFFKNRYSKNNKSCHRL